MNLNDASSRMPDVTHTPSQSTPFKEPTSDNHLLGGFTWRHPRTDFERPVVIINAATSLRCRYYSRFADYLYTNGLEAAQRAAAGFADATVVVGDDVKTVGEQVGGKAGVVAAADGGGGVDDHHCA